MKKCLEENSATFEDLKANRNSDETPEKIACFRKCMMLEQGLIDADGAIQSEKVSEMVEIFNVSDDKRQEIVSCVNEAESVKDCQDTGKVYQCFPTWPHH